MSAAKKLADAITLGKPARVALAFTEGADPDVQDHRGRTPLMLVIETAMTDATRKKMIEHFAFYGADLNMQDIDGNTALHLAAKRGDGTAVQALLKEGARVNLPTFIDVSPLHSAVQSALTSGRTDVIQLLLNNGADPDKTDIAGETPAEYANPRQPLTSHTQKIRQVFNDHAQKIQAIQTAFGFALPPEEHTAQQQSKSRAALPEPVDNTPVAQSAERARTALRKGSKKFKID
ncbi:MAG: ankyrin repeat domain-containing protein [Alphaproteobacteria bacterium]|nr:ankyrin repeat domain-containing protein [Alphaproteobacteria bacterium]